MVGGWVFIANLSLDLAGRFDADRATEATSFSHDEFLLCAEACLIGYSGSSKKSLEYLDVEIGCQVWTRLFIPLNPNSLCRDLPIRIARTSAPLASLVL